jgi:hypothetical protein
MRNKSPDVRGSSLLVVVLVLGRCEIIEITSGE